MERLWILAKRLEGKTLKTEKGRSTFKIISVSDTRLAIDKDDGRRYKRQVLEDICCHWLKGGDLTTESVVDAGIDNVNRQTGEYTYQLVIARAILGIEGESEPGGA